MTIQEFFNKLNKLREQRRIEKCVRRGEPIPFDYKGKTYFLNPDQAAVYHIQNSTEKLMKMIRLASSEARICFDVGANCGLFSALLARESPEIQSHAFEPSEELHTLIKKNCRDMKLTLVDRAVGDSEGVLPFFVNPDSQQTNSCNYDAVAMCSDEKKILKREVPVTTLDKYASDLGIEKVDILKIDVQGFEGAVFRGAKTMMPSVREIFVESTWMDVESIVNVIPLAREYGFSHLSVINPVYMGVDLMLSREAPSDPSLVEASYLLEDVEQLPRWI